MIDPSFYTFNQPIAAQVIASLKKHLKTEHIAIEALTGGRSVSKNFILKDAVKTYILRLMSPSQTLLNRHRELSAFQAASQAGVSPTVYFISPDFSFSLIEWINTTTLTIAQAKNPHNWKGIAQAFRSLHQLPKNPYPRASKVEIFSSICDEKEEFQDAKKRLTANDAQIKNFGDHSTTIHGDPHPRNLFLKQDGTLVAVDWEDTNWDDPFYDISFFSLLHLLNEKEEKAFLKQYLQEVTEDQMARYYLCKENSLIFLALICIDQSYDLALEAKIVLEERSLEDWSDYVRKWAESSDHPPQFFYDWGKASLKLLQ